MGKISRVTLVVLDSVGIGELPDAADFGDVGSNTLGNLSVATGGIALPNLKKLGLGNLTTIKGVEPEPQPLGAFGRAKEVSIGKDTTTGHWEMSGVILERPFPNYMDGFSADVINELIEKTGRGVLWNKAASGTVVIQDFGEEQLQSGKWIVYTSADPVLQIAANESIIPLGELYKACEIALEICTRKSPVARVIARPFVGEKTGEFKRTSNRHDFSIEPTGLTLLDKLKDAGQDVIGVGKISDIFAGRGITDNRKSNTDNVDGIKKTLIALKEDTKGLIFTNLVDFDMLYGHRRDPEGYKRSLEEFDGWLPDLQNALRDDEILIITADHGNDPTYKGTDHTREYIPILVYGKYVKSGIDIGTRDSFTAIAATIEELLLDKEVAGSFAKQIVM